MWDCKDCNRCTKKLGEYPYALKQEIWESVGLTHQGDDGMLCIHCCEKRLKRKLNKLDFYIFRNFFSKTKVQIDHAYIDGKLVRIIPYYNIIPAERFSHRLKNRLRRSV